jgi:sugar lactone lactonase YvrE
MKLFAILLFSTFLVSCGGGGGGGTSSTVTPPPTTITLAAMVDSLGRPVPEAEFGGGDGGAAGADGSAGDGAPIANAAVVLTDNAGHTATATTDTQGYYRVNIKGFTPPFVAKVTRSDGSFWYSHSTTPVQTRGFVTMNLTGLTDKVASYVADASNLGGDSSKVTPTTLAANPSALQASKDKLNIGLTSPLTHVGLNPASFDAVKSPYQAVKTDNYDRLLERVIVTKDRAKGNSVVVGTFAGARETLIDGVGTAATFSAMLGVVADSNGNVFVADTDNHAIRKITPTGVVSTFAGNGSVGFVNGTGTAATFNSPSGVAVDSSGNVFVADTGNAAIRKITPTGAVSTFAGTGSGGFVNGTGTAARFSAPAGVAVDSSGNVFVADPGNAAIRKITPTGVVSTFAGNGSAGRSDGSGTAASFFGPIGVAVDSSGSVFVADKFNNAIRKIDRSGNVSTVAKITDLSNGVSRPLGVTVDSSGNVFYTTAGFVCAIFKLSDTGGISTFAGHAGTCGAIASPATASTAYFFQPTSLTFDSSGNLFVADTGNTTISKITSAGVVTNFAGARPYGGADGTVTDSRFSFPEGVAVDSSGNVFVADTLNGKIRKVTPTGVVSTFAGSNYGFVNGIGTTASFTIPKAIAVDSTNGNVFVADSNNHAIRKITAAGVVSTFAGSGNAGFSNGNGAAASFNFPVGVAVDSSGNVFVADSNNNAIRKISPAGIVSTFADASAGLSGPGGVAVDSNGNVYAMGPTTLLKMSLTGAVSTLAGGGSNGFTDGIGSAASFGRNTGELAVDGSGNVYLADRDNNAIRKVTQTGAVSTLSGDGTPGYFNGSKTIARFNAPMGVAVDRGGNVYVADTQNSVIRIILP